MITVTINDDETLQIDGEILAGEKINGLCCDGFDSVVVKVFPDPELIYHSVWYGCDSPSHDGARETDMYAGIGSDTVEDIALFLIGE